MLLPGRSGYDRGRLTSVPGPGAGNHDSPYALLPPHLPRAPWPGRLPAGPIRGHPTVRTPGSDRCHITRAGAVNLTCGQHDCCTSRLVDSHGLAAHLLASHGPGPPRHHHRTPTRTGPTAMGPRSTWTYSVTPAPVATPVQMPPSTPRPLRARDHGI
jgi:hypothetical protein